MLENENCNHNFPKSWVPCIVFYENKVYRGQSLNCHECGEILKEKLPNGEIIEVKSIAIENEIDD